jgi:triacylglycerol esterase/lipase EstA (alpha/beta hydrolase family)
LLGYSVVLAIEFVTLVLVNRSDTSPKANLNTLMRAFWAESKLVAKVFCWRQPFRANAVPDQTQGQKLQGQRGVVFVHGLLCNRGFWTPWLEKLQNRGVNQPSHAFIALSMEPVFGGIDEFVDQIEIAVQLVTKVSGLAPILVCHSMGGLAARAWFKRQTGYARVHHVVTIATPHQGTWLARFALGGSGRQMRQGSDWLRQLDELPVQNGFEQLPKSNSHRADLFTCWYSNCDNIVFPTSAAMMSGANNRFVTGAAHMQLAFTKEVMEATFDMIIERPNL